MLRSRKVIFVHGIFGWGKDEVPLLSYWGDGLAQFKDSGFEVHEVKCGPVSSFQDRACEVYAQIKGGDFLYPTAPGAEGTKRAKVARSERQHVPRDPLHPTWSADDPVILVGHSAGAHTCLALQRLLKTKFFGDTNADWIEAVICISGVLNGSTLAYMFGCDPTTGMLTDDPERLIRTAVNIADHIPAVGKVGIELWLDQWTDQKAFVRGKDNLAYDLTLQGCHAANVAFSSHPNTYYLSVVTNMGASPSILGGLNILLQPTATFQAKTVKFEAGAVPLQDWNTRPELRIEAWRENDGAVSEISQHFPFTAHQEPFGQEGFFKDVKIERGKWYFERAENVVGRQLDHLDPGFGVTLKLGAGAAAAQQKLYQELAGLLKRMAQAQ